MKVLIADDDPIFISLMVDILAGEGYEVVQAENGRVAWEQLQAEAVDLAVLDMNMPDMDGVELIKLIRADERFAKLPVMVLTIGFRAKDIVQENDPSVTDYMTKPFDVDDMLAKVRQMLPAR